jgi:hypothetical protein
LIDMMRLSFREGAEWLLTASYYRQSRIARIAKKIAKKQIRGVFQGRAAFCAARPRRRTQ